MRMGAVDGKMLTCILMQMHTYANAHTRTPMWGKGRGGA